MIIFYVSYFCCVFFMYWKIPSTAIKSSRAHKQPEQAVLPVGPLYTPRGVESAAFHKGSSWGKHEKPFITQFTRADNITHMQGQTCGPLDRCERANPLLFPWVLKGVCPPLRPREAGRREVNALVGGVFPRMDEFEQTFVKERCWQQDKCPTAKTKMHIIQVWCYYCTLNK